MGGAPLSLLLSSTVLQQSHKMLCPSSDGLQIAMAAIKSNCRPFTLCILAARFGWHWSARSENSPGGCEPDSFRCMTPPVNPAACDSATADSRINLAMTCMRQARLKSLQILCCISSALVNFIRNAPFDSMPTSPPTPDKTSQCPHPI